MTLSSPPQFRCSSDVNAVQVTVCLNFPQRRLEYYDSLGGFHPGVATALLRYAEDLSKLVELGKDADGYENLPEVDVRRFTQRGPPVRPTNQVCPLGHRLTSSRNYDDSNCVGLLHSGWRRPHTAFFSPSFCCPTPPGGA
jgi:hypothetical protein